MNILKAIKRTSTTTGQVNKLRSDGFIPAILYGGKKSNLKISIKKLYLQDFIKTETFMSKIFDMEIDGNAEKVLPREIAYDPVSDEPIHIDFVRIAKGSKLILEIPVKLGDQVIQSNNFSAGTTVAVIADLNKMIFENLKPF